ncbi:MAG TPA: carbamoyltransferase N-terminal domain-containing protein, partial [Thermoanaerobaculia bacterium]|nr:carbamoyltransferase N-terminal domain-containing protein [Thermoanaerobaculia bacterium]
MKLLGISCYYHDSAACLIDAGRIVAAAQEERFTRIKHDSAFPVNAVRYCLAQAGDGLGKPARLDGVVFYDKPLLKFHRILETYLAVAPRGLRSYVQALPLWLREKLWIPPRIEEALALCGADGAGGTSAGGQDGSGNAGAQPPIYFTEHHESHAASAFYPSPFDQAAVLTLDGVGEWATTTIGVGEGERLRLIREIRFPHSLGLLYSAFTYFTGFKVNSGEYKLMGLAPYGTGRYTDLIKKELIDLREDGSFRLNMEYFGYLDGLEMTNRRFAALFGGPPRRPESPIGAREMDLARSIQEVTEEVVLKLARHARELTGKRCLCLAGGVALNCVANGILLRAGIFDDLWIQPAAGDAGGALGAPLALWHNALGNPRVTVTGAGGKRRDLMQGALLGPDFGAGQIREYLDHQGLPYEELADADWAPRIARLIADGNVVGLCHGRMEFGPRALGNRSIVGDARSPRMQSIMNLKIKYRESFRPFAPTVLEERVGDYFELDRPSPYMLLVADVVSSRRVPRQGDEESLPLVEWVNRPRSDVPAITHVDYSARIQTVSREENPRYHALLAEFERQTGCGVIVNT